MSTKIHEWLGKLRMAPPPDIDCIGLKFRLEEKGPVGMALLGNEKYYPIADDFENRICINEVSGAIESVGRTGENSRYFVNCDIDSFLYFVREFYEFDRKTKRFEASDIAMELAALRSKLGRRDPAALRVDAWWSFILEQVEQGLL